MKPKEIAKTYNCSVPMVYQIIQGVKKTTMLEVATAVSKITGKRPIDYVSITYRKIALKAFPELGRKTKSKV